ncbi:MAG: hypothetical protein PWP04_603 [Candidatus Atribacteria bacterium]|nr:hypothetical protein [Candidatus Atribacteria bacterium]
MDGKVDLTQYRLSAKDLRWFCDPNLFPFQCVDEIASLEGFIGQERALSSIDFGLQMNRTGYNLFVTGPSRSGRVSAIHQRIKEFIKQKKEEGEAFEIHDWCYHFNFDSPDQPKVLALPRGKGKVFSQKMEKLLKDLRDVIPKTFASDDYKNQRQILLDEHQRQHRAIIQQLERRALEEGFAFRMTSMGPILVPLVQGKPMTQEQYLALSDEEKEKIEQTRQKLLQEINQAFEVIHRLEAELKNRIAELDKKVAEFAISPFFRELLQDYADFPEVVDFLQKLKDFTLSYLHIFRDSQESASASPPPALVSYQRLQDPFLPFKVNVFVDNSSIEDPPIVVETHPNWNNLFGKIERKAFMGAYFSDHTMLKAGSLHRANGGYIILYFRDLITNPGVWDGLKRALKNQEIKLEDPFEHYGLIVPQGLRPDPLPLQTKVVIVGEENFYQLLTLFDDDFPDLFKVKVEFDYQLNKDDQVIQSFACFVKNCCQENSLLAFDRTGVAKTLEYASRLVSHKKKLSSRFGLIRDLLVEADYWARQENASLINSSHVKKAVDEKIKRTSLIRDRIEELIQEDVFLIDTDGLVTGQVNGLAVYDLGDFSFGRPSRITARTFLGKQGVVNIERESKLSGKIHDKGVLILGGYLGYRYAQNKPLSISASICFEQSYQGVEGDSASLAETCAVLSSISGVPLRQDIAITGSINQKGEVQAIGGVNQKIEGFFRVCQARGLTGKQGVIIPSSNVPNLMLEEEVVKAVETGEFHIYQVSSVDQALEILTGLPAGAQLEDGTFEPGSVNYLVDTKLRETVDLLKQLGEKGEGNN